MARQFTDMHPMVKVWELVGAAAVAGGICALLDGVNTMLYAGAVIVCILGSLPAGRQHSSAAAAAVRGAVVGTVWGIALVVVHQITGLRDLIPIGNPVLAIVVYAAVPNSVLTLAVYALSHRSAGGPVTKGARRGHRSVASPVVESK